MKENAHIKKERQIEFQLNVLLAIPGKIYYSCAVHIYLMLAKLNKWNTILVFIFDPLYTITPIVYIEENFIQDRKLCIYENLITDFQIIEAYN